MKRGQRFVGMLVVGAALLLLSMQMLPAQEQPGRREGRQFDPSRMMERMLDRCKETMAPTDEEWKVVEPLLKKTLEARQETRMFGFGRRRGESSSTGNPEADALSKALESKETKPDEIKAKLAAYREAQKKKEEALKKAREDLRKVLTVKQEAQLVLMGILD